MKFALRNYGFTLIEILVVTSIMAVVFLVGFAGFRDYSRRQQLASLARQLQGDLRNTQERALSGEKPNSSVVNYTFCASPNVLDGYNINAGVVGGGYGYWITALCSPGGNVQTKMVMLPAGYTIVRNYVNGPPPATVLSIKPLGQGTNIPVGTDAVFTITDSTGATNIVTLTSSGEVK